MQKNMMKKLITANGIEHGLLEEISNAVPNTDFKDMTEKNRKEMLERKKKDLELVEVKYQNVRNTVNGKWEGGYCDYAGEPLRVFRFLHNHVYKIPRGLARKISEMGAPKRSGLVDSSGMELTVDGEYEKSHQMIPVGDF